MTHEEERRRTAAEMAATLHRELLAARRDAEPLPSDVTGDVLRDAARFDAWLKRGEAK